MQNFKLGFDAKRGFNNQSGLGVYSRSLLKFIFNKLDHSQIILFTPSIKLNLFRIPNNLKIISSNLGSLWRSFFIYFDLKKEKIKIYHGLAGELPFWIPNSTKTIVTIHDLLFLQFPTDYNFIDRNIYSFKAKYACHKAEKIIAVSLSTKNKIVEYYSISPDKIEVIPVGLDIEIKPYSRLYSKEYMVCISSFLPRKNQALVIEAFNHIATEVDIDIIFIGSGSYWNDVKILAENSPFNNRIIFIKKATDEEKFAYLSHARFSVYPSLFEGFGIPIIESMAFQVPIIVSDTAIHKEVADDAAIYFENNNAEDLGRKMLSTYNLSEQELEIIKQKGLARVDKYKVENVYPSLLEIYRDLVTV